ncbi:MAG: hypothetical protein KDD66_18755 [Bdellovibrionales bacterium]|nr:hypothetical protein [Bdellovibrionales bacterium]
MRLCVFCLMPNHWHLALWPQQDNIVSRFMRRPTGSHVRVWRNVGEPAATCIKGDSSAALCKLTTTT